MGAEFIISFQAFTIQVFAIPKWCPVENTDIILLIRQLWLVS